MIRWLLTILSVLLVCIALSYHVQQCRRDWTHMYQWYSPFEQPRSVRVPSIHTLLYIYIQSHGLCGGEQNLTAVTAPELSSSLPWLPRQPSEESGNSLESSPKLRQVTTWMTSHKRSLTYSPSAFIARLLSITVIAQYFCIHQYRVLNTNS